MPRKKLSKNLKEKIKSDYRQLRKKDFDGEALTYLNRVKGAAKARAAKKKQFIQVGNEQIKRSSELGKVLEKSAESKRQSVKKFVSENLEQVQNLKRDYRETINKGIDNVSDMIQDKPSNAKVFVNGKKISDIDAIFQIEKFSSVLRRKDKTVMQILMDVQVDLKGNIYLKLPAIRSRGKNEDIEDYLEELEEFLEEEDITLIISDKGSKKK